MEGGVIELKPTSTNIPTVVIRNAVKYYGTKRKISVLENLNMTVPKGVIYGLLGSSGCGKTTLLSCILGQKLLNSGKLWVMGGAPGTKQSKVPGPQIGYMPQLNGVQPEFTICETITYFGRIAGMSFREIDKKLNELKTILLLPNLDKRIGSLSGGEQRRVSFTIALLHQPELVILDEPTVGLDPLIRENIWRYLYEITSIHEITVILTTHYIDETRKANMVGLLRHGSILAEDSPDHLLRQLEVNTLEEAFLHLSKYQNQNRIVYSSECNEVLSSGFGQSTPKKTISIGRHLKSTISKIFFWFTKHPALLIITILIPFLQVLTFDIGVGHDPFNLNLAVANDETHIVHCPKLQCNGVNLSCHFLNYLKEKTFILKEYNSEKEAIDSVLHGSTYASIYFKPNYSSALHNRIYNKKVSQLALEDSTIEVFRDLSVYNIAVFIKVEMLVTLKKFIEDYMVVCNSTTRSISVPIHWNDPIYGKHLPDFAEFATPAMLLMGLVFFVAWATASMLLIERGDGITERMLVMGVKPVTIILSHLITECVIVLFQLALLLPYCFFIIKLPLTGSFALVALIIASSTLLGMSFGILLYSTCSSDFSAGLIIMGTFFPTGILSGIIWPVEGMPHIVQKLAAVLPFLGMCDSFRSVLQRGWDLTHPQIYWSFICVSLWTISLLICAIICLKIKKRSF